MHHLVALDVVGEEVGEVDEAVAVIVELGRSSGAQAPVGASTARLRHGGDEDSMLVPCMFYPGGLFMREVDVGGREADLLLHLSERGCVRSFAEFSAAAEILPDAVGSAHEGAVSADDNDAGA